MWQTDINQAELDAAVAALKNKPDLCHKCAKCCLSATTGLSHKELLQKVDEGNESAVDFLRVFKPFESLEAASKVVPEQVKQVVAELKSRGKTEDEITFYYCEHVTDEGLCGIYENRPACCKMAPGNAWMMMPPGCGFEGWQFLNREKQRAEIRKLKELQYQMKVLSTDGQNVPLGHTSLAELDERVTKSTEAWAQYGAQDW